MINLIRMNIYRMFNTTSMHVLLLITMAFAVFSTYMSVTDLKNAQNKSEIEQEAAVGLIVGEGENVTEMGVYIDPPKYIDGKPAPFLNFYCVDIASGILLIFITIACVLFVNSEEKYGFVKNIAGQTKYRLNIYLSKLIVLIAYIVASMLLYGLVQYITLKILYKGDIGFGINILGDAANILGIWLLLSIGYVSGIMLLTTLFKSTTISITIGMLITIGFNQFLTGFIYTVLDFNLNKYLIVCNMKALSLESGSSSISLAIIIGIVYTFVYNFVGTICITKRDVV